MAIRLAAAAFLGASIVNAVAAPARRSRFARRGYPAWRCRATGGLAAATAALIAFTTTRQIGLGAAIIAAAVVTVVRHRDPTHLAPLGVFAVLLVLAVV